MTKFALLLFTGLLAYSCARQKSIKYYWVMFQGHEYEKADTTQITDFDKLQNGDTIKLSYFAKYGSLTYFIIDNKDSSFIISNPKNKLVSRNDSLVFMRHIFDTSVIVRKETFRIKEYILDEFAQDGSSIHYYEPTLGLFAAHSGTWPGIRYLQSNDSNLNTKILSLIKATVPKFFIRGQLDTNLK